MAHCISCGGPSYTSPCSACKSKGVKAPTAAPAERIDGPSIDLNDFPRWRAFHNLASRLYNKAKAQPTFNRDEWVQLEEVVRGLALTGLGNGSPLAKPEPEPPSPPESPVPDFPAIPAESPPPPAREPFEASVVATASLLGDEINP